MTKSVLVAVLDWGLGHATRCVPVIRELLNQNFRVVLGGCGPSLQFLKEEFTELTSYELPSYKIVYPEKSNLLRSLFFQVPGILRAIDLEHSFTQHIIEEENINYIISDNRYGCYSKSLKSVFIGHQLNLLVPRLSSLLSGAINRLHLNRIKRFNEIWIPDEHEGFRLAGLLSKNSLPNVQYTGILSRFGNVGIEPPGQYELVGLISGPEPQRSIFEKMLRDQLIGSNQSAILIKGKPGSTHITQNGTLAETDHLESSRLESILANASAVICRSGYSTIMDLCVLGKKVVLVPTPGQTEQEYLGEYLSNKKMAVCHRQSEFDLAHAMNQLPSISALSVIKPNSRLPEVIRSL